MPLIFNNTIIKELNGPYSMTCLEPRGPLQYYIILFGDIHNEENMRDCDNTKCYDLQYEFIEKLNIFAEQVKVEFYVEDFFSYFNDIYHPDKKQDIKRRQTEIKEIMDDTHLKIRGNTEQKYTIRKKYNDKKFKKQSAVSHMTEFIDLYKGCFYPHIYKRELCPYKNIFWQFADTRKLSKTRRDFNIFIFSYMLLELDDLYNMLETTPSVKRTKDISNYLITLFMNINIISNIQTMLRYFKLALIDLPLFVNFINDTRTIHKQREKLIPSMNSILSVESFVHEIFMYYLKTCRITTDIDKLIQILDILIDNFPEDASMYSEYDYDDLPESKLLEVQHLTELFNNIRLTKSEVTYYKHLPTVLSAGFLDIYFILRIFKQPEDDYKLVLGYFGDAHKESIINYLKNVLNYDISFHRKMRTVRRIYIEPTINLNKFFHLQEEYNSGLRDYVVIKSRRTSSSSRKRRHNKSLQGKQLIIHPDFVHASPR
jgi:hypothetical protein